jgi:hypothetical protein
MKFEIIHIKKRLLSFWYYHTHEVTVQFENGHFQKYYTVSPDNELFFFELNEAMKLDGEVPGYIPYATVIVIKDMIIFSELEKLNLNYLLKLKK